MASRNTYAKYLNLQGYSGNTIGEIRKQQSDIVMEQTWNNDIQSKSCYIYDYFHDDFTYNAEIDEYTTKEKNITYDENTHKQQIDAKFIVVSHGSVSKDQVEYHIMFKPSQKFPRISEDKDKEFLPYYIIGFENKYNAEFPIGLYIDIPDDRGIYRKWLIVSINQGNQFVQYSILPCNYLLRWIKDNQKYQMWGVARLQSSYNSGVWTDRVITSTENQNLFWLPMNTLTSVLYYDQRIILSAPIEVPITWKISKVETIQPSGIMKLTLYQTLFDKNVDYVNLDTGIMYADYYNNKVDPINPNSAETNIVPSTKNYCVHYCTEFSLNTDASNRKITFSFFDKDDNDITDKYNLSDGIFTFSLDVNGEIIDALDFISYKIDKNIMKLKWTYGVKYMTQILTMKYIVNDIVNIIQFEIKG